MSETNKFKIPFLASGQAQKHVTVNEGFARLDSVVQLAVLTVDSAVPPSAPTEGDVHAVGSGATGDWSGQDGNLAVFQNGGWVYLTPSIGWQAWLVSGGSRAQFDGVDWVEGAGALTTNGAGFVHRSIEVDHDIAAGGTSTVVGALPANAIVYGVTARVLSAIGGASTIEIGVSSSTDRYGSGIGTALGSWGRGITGSPLAYYSATDLLLTASGGIFDGTGQIRLAVHYAELTLPRG